MGPISVFLPPPLRVGKGGELGTPLQIDLAGLAVAVFCDDALGQIGVFGVPVVVALPVEEEDDIGVLLDSRRSDSMGRLSVRDSLARESWLRHSTGTFSSLAISFREREMSDTTCWRLSLLRVLPPEDCISWR